MTDETERDPEQDNTFYVGAPTEYADVEEMPGWVQNAVRVIAAMPALLTTLGAIEIGLLMVLCVCLGLFALLFLV